MQPLKHWKSCYRLHWSCSWLNWNLEICVRRDNFFILLCLELVQYFLGACNFRHNGSFHHNHLSLPASPPPQPDQLPLHWTCRLHWSANARNTSAAMIISSQFISPGVRYSETQSGWNSYRPSLQHFPLEMWRLILQRLKVTTSQKVWKPQSFKKSQQAKNQC